MIGKALRWPVLMAGLPQTKIDHMNFDVVDPKYKLGRQPGNDDEDGWERVKRMFSTE